MSRSVFQVAPRATGLWAPIASLPSSAGSTAAKGLVLAACVLGSSVGATHCMAQTNLIANGGFEQPGFNLVPDNYRYLNGANATLLTGWTVTTDGNGEPSYVYHRTRYPVFQGDYSLALNDGDSIATNLNLVQATDLVVVLAAVRGTDGLAPGSSANGALRVAIGGVSATIDTFAGGTPLPGSGNPPFRRFVIPLAAIPAGVTQLRLTNLPNGLTFGGIGIDDVAVYACQYLTRSPESLRACAGGNASFVVESAGQGPFSYQWRKGGTPIDAATNPSAASATLTLGNVGAADVASYDCIVTNSCGSVTSGAATLTLAARCSLADIVGTSSPAPGGTIVCGDSVVDGSDFIAFINSFSAGDVAVDPLADVAGGGDDGLSPDGIVDGNDFVAFINAFSAGC